MDLPDDFYQIIVLVVAISILWAFVTYYTKRGKNFRSSRSKRARRES